MTTIPAVQTKANFDAATDDPKQARGEFADNVDLYNNLRSWLIVGLGTEDTPALILANLSGLSVTAGKTAAQNQDGIHVTSVGGTADVITLTASPVITGYAVGQIFSFLATGSNTTTVTVNIDAQGAKTVKKNGGPDNLQAGDIRSGALVRIQYDGTNFVMIGQPTAAPAFLGTVTGTNTLTVVVSPTHLSYVTGRRYIFVAANANTGSVTLNIDGLGAKTLKKQDGSTNLVASDIAAGEIVESVYDGTFMQVVSALSGETGGGVVLIDSEDMTGASFKNLEGMDDTFDWYQVVFNDLVLAGDKVQIRVRLDGSGSYESGASDYDTWTDGNSNVATDNAARITNDNSASNVGMNGRINLMNYRQTANNPRNENVVTFRKSGGNFVSDTRIGFFNTAGTKIQAVQVRSDGATNFTSGTVQLYGIKGATGV